MLTAVNLEELVLAWHKSGKTWLTRDTDVRVSRVNYLQGDELSYTLDYGNSFYYRDDFTVSYTELLLWYINQRTGA